VVRILAMEIILYLPLLQHPSEFTGIGGVRVKGTKGTKGQNTCTGVSNRAYVATHYQTPVVVLGLMAPPHSLSLRSGRTVTALTSMSLTCPIMLHASRDINAHVD